MATKRLTDWDRNALQNAVERMLNKLITSAELPDGRSKEIWAAMWMSCLSPEERTAIDVLAETGALSSDYQNKFTITPPGYAAHNVCYNRLKMPSMIPTMEAQNSRYDRVAKWVGETVAATDRRDTNFEFFKNVLRACGSGGQIIRVLPYLINYLPDDVRVSLSDAERRSRWPTSLKKPPYHNEAVEELHNTLALVALLPDIEGGSRPWVEDC